MPEYRGGGINGHDFNFKPDCSIPPFEKIFSKENLLASWREFSRGKKHKADVAEFSVNLISNLWRLHDDILGGRYRHGGYTHFVIRDQKKRDIHKASVRDRIVHHALYRVLYKHFDRKFVFDSYSSRLNKGVHRAIYRFKKLADLESFKNSKTVWVLKCDIRKCFASISHEIFKSLIFTDVRCPKTQNIINSVVDSFRVKAGRGIPLGNLTSQIFVNVYLNELDQFAKKFLGADKYIRYADDFIFISRSKRYLEAILPQVEEFLKFILSLSLRLIPKPIQTINSGLDFLGWVNFPNHRVLRRNTRKNMAKRLESNRHPETLASYAGLLKHGNTYNLRQKYGLAEPFE